MNNKNIFWIALLAILASSCEYWFQKERVGAIYFDYTKDQSDFHPCDDDHIAEYYRSLPVYQEGLRDLTSHFLSDTPSLPDTLSVYFTTRFIDNCESWESSAKFAKISNFSRHKDC